MKMGGMVKKVHGCYSKFSRYVTLVGASLATEEVRPGVSCIHGLPEPGWPPCPRLPTQAETRVRDYCAHRSRPCKLARMRHRLGNCYICTTIKI